MTTTETGRLMMRCPECDAAVHVESATLIEGNLAECPHCREQFMLAREWNEDGCDFHWQLMEASVDEGDERR